MKRAVSVIICSHNPRQSYLRRVLDALQEQTLSTDRWELILIDNASNEPLAPTWDVSWHVNARHVREDELGLTPARLRGIEESVGELLVFVDDDNVLAEDYLSAAVDLSAHHLHIGAFGGSIKGEFEVPPPEGLLPYIAGLAVFEIERDYWSNMLGWCEAVPYGAGLCVRRNVALDYLRKVKANPKRKGLDRCGSGLAAGGDSDLAWCAVDLGMGTGRFCRLKMTHLIPKDRLTPEYITRLYAGSEASGILLESFRCVRTVREKSVWEEAPRLIWNLLRASSIERSVLLASRKARKEAVLLLETWPSSEHRDSLLGR